MSLNNEQRKAIAAIDGPPPEEAGQGGTPQPQETAQGQAQSDGAPKSESEKLREEAFIEINLGNGQTRKMTESQIAGMAARYTGLNQKNAQMKPVIALAEKIMQANPNLTPAQLGQELAEYAQQRMSGGSPQNTPPRPNEPAPNSNSGTPSVPSDDDLAKWENENASTLPPGYRQMQGNMNQMAQQMSRMTEAMQQVLAQTTGQVEAARMAQQGARQVQGQSVQQTIGNNLDAAQQRLQLPTDMASPFMEFAAQRGYTMEDFVDPDLTLTVMNDFKNHLSSGEMDRLRGIQERRQAFTTPTGGAPSGPQGQPSEEQADFDAFAGRMAEKRRL